MRAGMSTNARQILRKMQARPAAVKRELEQVARQKAPQVAGVSKKILQTDVYDVPIPLKAGADRKLGAKAAVRTKTTKGSAGKWQRTGDLKRNETATADGVDITLRNNSAHSAARHALGGPAKINKAGRRAGTQRPQSDVPAAQRSKTRSVQWQWEAAEQSQADVMQARREGVLRGLTSP